MNKKIKISPLAEHIEEYSDLKFDRNDDDFETYDNPDVPIADSNERKKAKSLDPDLDAGQVHINHKADKYLSAAAWFHEMKIRGMTSEEERYVELMLIELASFYFSNFESRHPSKKCQEALDVMCKAMEKQKGEKILCTKC